MTKYAYVGCRTTKERNARGKGIKVFAIDKNGQWTLIQTLGNLVNPSFLCFDRTGDYLYTVHGDYSEISSFAVNKNDGTIKLLNTVSSGGGNPVHLSVDKSNRWIFVANLQTGTVAVITRNEDGTLGTLKALYTIPGNDENSISHPHQVMQDQRGDYLIVPCQGRKQGFGQTNVFKINSADGTLHKTDMLRSREIAEPRHVVFHPNNHWCYGVNEKDYSIIFYRFDAEAGKLLPQQILPTLPETYTGDGWASGIMMSGDNNHVIVSNRKHDSITSFKINPNDGMLTYCDCIKTGGGQPRFIALNENHRNIIAANETTDTITMFTIDAETGKFTAINNVIATESPVCVIFG